MHLQIHLAIILASGHLEESGLKSYKKSTDYYSPKYFANFGQGGLRWLVQTIPIGHFSLQYVCEILLLGSLKIKLFIFFSL